MSSRHSSFLKNRFRQVLIPELDQMIHCMLFHQTGTWIRSCFSCGLKSNSSLKLSIYQSLFFLSFIHGSHIHPDVIDLLVENKIILYCLPPRTTNILQPLDVAIFKPLKTKFSKITDLVKLASLCSPTPLNVSKKNFTVLFKVAFEQCMNLVTVKNGFRKCSIAPFDPDAIDKKHLMPSTQCSSSHQTKQFLSSLQQKTPDMLIHDHQYHH